MHEPIIISAENAVEALTECVLSVLGQLGSKEDMKIVLQSISAPHRKLISQAALANEHYLICQAIKEVDA